MTCAYQGQLEGEKIKSRRSLFFFLFWLHPVAYRSSSCNNCSSSCSNPGSLTHCPRPGIEPVPPQRPNRSLSHCTTAGTPKTQVSLLQAQTTKASVRTCITQCSRTFLAPADINEVPSKGLLLRPLNKAWPPAAPEEKGSNTGPPEAAAGAAHSKAHGKGHQDSTVLEPESISWQKPSIRHSDSSACPTLRNLDHPE